MRKQTRLQAVHIGPFFRSFLSFRKHPADQFFQKRNGRSQQDNSCQPVQGVRQRDQDHRHLRFHKGEMEDRVEDIEDDAAQNGSQHIDDQIDEGGPLAIGACAKRAEHDRDGGADADAHQDRKGHVKFHSACHSQCLQDTDRCACALQNCRYHQTDQDAENRIRETRQELNECRIFPQRLDGAGHQRHAEHQHGEAQHDAADIFQRLFFCSHPDDDARKRYHACQNLGAEIRCYAGAGSAQTVETENPACNTGSQDRTQDNADALPHFHHAGIDKPDDHDRGRRRRLDDGRHAGAQQNAFDRIAGEFEEDHLHLAAGHFLQGVSHDGHSEKEHRDSAEKGNDIAKIHRKSPFLQTFA